MRTRQNPVLFAVTYEIVTPESAEHCDADDRGHITEGSEFATYRSTPRSEIT